MNLFFQMYDKHETMLNSTSVSHVYVDRDNMKLYIHNKYNIKSVIILYYDDIQTMYGDRNRFLEKW